MEETTGYLATENDDEQQKSVTTSTSYPPCENLCFCEERYLEYEDEENVVVYGTEKQQEEMFKDWSSYIGEITNPGNTATNTFFKNASGKGSQYAPLDEVLNNARPILAKWGFGIFQSPKYDNGHVAIKTILTHKSGGSINFPSLKIPVAKQDAQGIIAGITYARRGILNPILCTHGEIDDDGNSCVNGVNKRNTSEKQKQDDHPTELVNQEVLNKRKEIIDLANSLINKGVDRNVVNATIKKSCNVANPNNISDITLLNNTIKALSEIKISN